jgi:hypothetical protein
VDKTSACSLRVVCSPQQHTMRPAVVKRRPQQHTIMAPASPARLPTRPDPASGVVAADLSMASVIEMRGPASVPVVLVPTRFRPALAGVVERLAALDYQGLKRDGIDPFRDTDLSLWIRSYGNSGTTIVPLPEGAWSAAEAGRVDAHPGQWWAIVPLWTRDEGMSDLSLEATITESADGVKIVIDNIRVL